MPPLFAREMLMRALLTRLRVRAARHSGLRRLRRQTRTVADNLVFVNPGWRLELALRMRFSRKKRVGFGPIMSGERTLGTRKFHIDPIVRFINQHSAEYVCDVFFENTSHRRLLDYDVLVIVKTFDFVSPDLLRGLTGKGVRLVYSIVDNPAGCARSYLDDRGFLESMDGLIITNPVQAEDVRGVDAIHATIPPPVIGRRHKEDYATNGPVTILWEGMAEHLEFMDHVNPIVRRVARDSGTPVRLVYYSDLPPRADGIITYVPWKLSRWEERLVGGDVAIVVKPPENALQRRKPPTKVQNYMAAGLPVVCTPSESDKLVITDGRTGFFAHSEDEWYQRLRALVDDAGLRERVGRAAREAALRTANLERVAALHLDLFRAVQARPRRPHDRAPVHIA